mgnify:CR=1 FL=1
MQVGPRPEIESGAGALGLWRPVGLVQRVALRPMRLEARPGDRRCGFRRHELKAGRAGEGARLQHPYPAKRHRLAFRIQEDLSVAVRVPRAVHGVGTRGGA